MVFDPNVSGDVHVFALGFALIAPAVIYIAGVIIRDIFGALVKVAFNLPVEGGENHEINH